MEKSNFDVVIIGAGITGSGIAYELSKLQLSIAILDKAPFPFQGASKANSGIIHAGYDDPDGSMRAKMVVRGNQFYSRWADELGFDFKRIGSIVVAFTDEEVETLKEEMERGQRRGIEGLEIVEGKALFDLEPNLNKSAIAGLYAPSAGVVCPMEVVNFLFRASVANGVTPFLSCEVKGFRKEAEKITHVETTCGEISGRIIINAAGVFGDKISSLAGIDRYRIIPRKGEYILLEPHPDYDVNHVIFPVPTRVSKGVLVIKTVTGDVLIGPTARNLEDSERENTLTTPDGLQEVLEKAKKLVPSLSTALTVKTFAGIRAQPSTNDFIIEDYDEPSNFINVIGIRSPGLTSAPAIAEYVVEMVRGKLDGVEPKKDFFVPQLKKPDPVEMMKKRADGWGVFLTPHLDSPPLAMLEMAWNWGIKGELYNYTCFTDNGLGVDLSATFQNELTRWLLKKGLTVEEINYRFPGSWQFVKGKCGGKK